MFVPILTDRFNQWFVQGAIPGSVIKSVIKHVCLGVDDYRLITELKILARVLANHLQVDISNLIGPK